MENFCVDAKAFMELGQAMMGRAVGLRSQTAMRKFCALFGVSPTCCAVVWEKLNNFRPKDDDLFICFGRFLF